MKKPIVRICVPYPNHGAVKQECLASLEAVLDMTEIVPQVKLIQGATISTQRNAGVNGHASQRVKQSVDFDYYLSLDSDIAFRPEQILQLIKHDLDIVGGAYVCRGEESKYVAGHFNPGTYRVTTDYMCTKDEDPVVKKVDWIGTGFMMVKKRVFEALDYPWFLDRVTPFEDENGVKCKTWVGEDVGFCISAQEAGYDVYVDLGCKVKHLLDTKQVQLKNVDTTTYLNSDSDGLLRNVKHKGIQEGFAGWWWWRVGRFISIGFNEIT